jgi:hypothetical protein
MLMGMVGGIVVVLFSHIFVLDWQSEKTATVTVDIERQQGAGSLKWDFHLKPRKMFYVSSARLSGALLHAETDPDDDGTIPSLDWQKFTGIRFFAKSSVEGLKLQEVNIFIGQKRVQYMFNAPQLLSTGWKEFELRFDRFQLPLWVTGEDRSLKPMLANVTGVGFDLKNEDRSDLQGTIWIDFIRLVNPNGTTKMFSNADATTFEFEDQKNTRLTWLARAQDY